MKKIFFATVIAMMSITATFAQNITLNPRDTNVCTGQGSSFIVAAQNASAYQWQAYSSGTWYLITDNSTYSGTSTAQLSIANATGMDGYSFRCIVTDTMLANDTSTIAFLNVLVSPHITTQPSSVTVCPQTAVSFSIALPGTYFIYQWQANSGSGFANISNNSVYSGATGNSLALAASGVNSSMSGIQYRCIVKGACGAPDTSAAAQLTIYSLPSSAISLSGSSTICQGDSVQLTAPVTSGHTYQWQFNSAAVANGSGSSIYGKAAGTYSVVMTNTTTGCSSVSSGTTVTVNPVPSITAAIASADSVCLGYSVLIAASVDTTLSYQWQQNGVDITGAVGTNYYAVTGGGYSVRVTNSYGCATTSATSNVTIFPLPLATITYNNPLSFCEGSAVVLTADTSSNNASYQWMRNGVPDSAATSYFNTVNQTGIYTISVTSSYGCNSVSAPLTVTVHPLPQPVIAQAGNTLSTGSFSTYQWFLNGLPITGATGAAYTATQSGIYSVEVTDTNGCPNGSSDVTVTALGVSGVTANNAITVYPNPTSGALHITAAAGKQNLMLRNMEGRVLLQQSNLADLDLTRFAKGMYLLTITDEKGALLKAEKIVLAN